MAAAVAAGAVLVGYCAAPGAATTVPASVVTGGGTAGGDTSMGDVPCGVPPISLDRTTQSFLDQLAHQDGKPLFEQTPAQARKVLDKLQAGPVPKLAAGRFGTSASTCPAQPEHRNPIGPVPDDHPVPQTDAGHPATLPPPGEKTRSESKMLLEY
ncbi:hypothetical protein ABZX64_34255 [Streptomyces misionensis]|uniref:hypothetical protein n=1 Tax=Streptomyces misionensis TaxID=67331 RepID=UPI0033A30E6F